MNAPSQPESNALVAAAGGAIDLAQLDAASLILGPAWDRIQAFGKMMARGAVTIPKHLQGNEADCTAVTLQAFGWRMNPYAVAQKTHISKSGQLGYEAQLVNAVIQASGELEGTPDYEAIGDWSKILGKCEERKSDNGGKYYVATYTRKDEEGLGVKIIAKLRGEAKPRELIVMMAQAWPRFSTQWATDPFQQICYLGLRKFVRLHKPGVLLGVYTNDELEPAAGAEKFMGPADVVTPAAATASGPASTGSTGTELPTMTDDDFAKREAKVREFYSKGKTAADIIAFYGQKFTVPEALQKRIRDMAAAPAAVDQEVTDVQPKDKPAADAPKVTLASVVDKIVKADDLDQLAEAETLIAAIAAPELRAEATAKAEARRAELTQGA